MYIYVIICPFYKGGGQGSLTFFEGFYLIKAYLRAAKWQFEEGPPESIEHKSL